MPVDRIPPGLKVVVPRYHGPDDPPQVPAAVAVFGHQYADNENTAPFGDSDINHAKRPLSQFISAWGTNGGARGVQEIHDVDATTTPCPNGLSEKDRALLEEVRDLLVKRTAAKKTPARKPRVKKVPANNMPAKRTARVPR